MPTKDNKSIPGGATSSNDFSQQDGQQTQPTGNQSNEDNGASSQPQSKQQPYSQFTGSNYADVENYIRRQMADYPIETEEERKKRERHERRVKSLASIADILGTMHKAYSYQRGVAPMDLPNISEKAQARFDKAKADRDKNSDRYLNYAITLGNLKDKDRDFNFRIEQARNQQNNWQDAFDAGRKDRADDVAYRDKAFQAGRDDRKEDVQWRKDRAAVEDDHWTKSFDEGKRQFNASSSLQRQSFNLQRRKLEHDLADDSTTITLGEGNGSVTVSKGSLNAGNLASVFQTLPQNFKNAVKPKIQDKWGGKPILGVADETAMLTAIGQYLGDPNVSANKKAATRSALIQLGKKSGGSRGRGY